ncbi:MAG: hypothetical protein R3B84_04270 [Zavarzinella sp.]
MVRKLLAVTAALMLTFGTVFAEEVKATFVKFAEGKLTVKVGEDTKEYKVPEDLKLKFGKKEVEVSKMLSNPKLKEGTKMTLDVEGDTLKGLKMGGGKKKKDAN